MQYCARTQIYKGIIQYLLDTTNYSLRSIAKLSNTSFKNIRTIYFLNELPPHFDSEIELVNLFQIILEMNIKQTTSSLYFK
ncbi:MAG: hypothetical protein H0U75_08860 [Legionella sp.]|nr:hypothetical protein [Legionella sp.]